MAQDFPEKGVPLLKNFSPAEYYHLGKIWEMDTSPNGLVYMAAGKGLLEYDGKNWKSFNGSEGITRSVHVVNDSLIYTGSDLDFGVWKRNAYRDFEYTSLYPFKEDLSELSEEFWNVHFLDSRVYFVSASNIYVYRNESLIKIQAPNEIKNSFLLDSEIYFADTDGLYRLEDLSPEKVAGFDEREFTDISGIYRRDGDLLMVTQNEGIFRYEAGMLLGVENRLSRNLEAASVFSFEKIDDKYLVFGTILKGMYITDLDGNIVHHINKNKGLQNNTILDIHYGHAGKLWLSMDYGVSYLDMGNEYTFVYDFRGDFGTGYSAVLLDNDFYLGTNQGLYRTGWESLNNNAEYYEFELVKGTEGQVWTLEVINNRLLIGHDRGIFILTENGVERLGNQRGIWSMTRYGEYLLAGTYNGVSIYSENENGGWEFIKKMELILGSCNQVVVEDEDTIWVNIPTYGVMRVALDNNLYPEERDIFFTSQFRGEDHYLEKEEEGIKVLTDSYNYHFDRNSGDFKEANPSDVQSGINDHTLRNTKPAQLNGDFMFYPVYNGFALRDLSIDGDERGNSSHLIFRLFESFNSDESKRLYPGEEIPYHMNNVRIVSIVPNQDDLLYQYRRDDSEEWSDWTPESDYEMINLAHGTHELSVRAMVGSSVTPVEIFKFSISPPWYRSWYAYMIYLLLFSATGYLVVAWQQSSLKKQKDQLLAVQQNNLQKQKKRHEEELHFVEEQKLKAEYEILKEKFKNKTIELATKAKENDEKKKILKTLKEKFEKLVKNPETFKHRSGEIQQIIDSHIEQEDNTFEIQIDELHQEFFDRLRQNHDELTRYDLRLCAYIKIGFDSKEIADMLNIKPSSVYISRSRLRKKLDIESDEDLHGYLNSI